MPSLVPRLRRGLLTVAVLPLAASVAAANEVVYSLVSEPAGYVNQTALGTLGSRVTTPSLQGENSGWVFSYWRIDGVRQAGPDGVAVPAASFTLTGPATATAVYLRATEDTDQDGLPDWYEWQQFGSLEQTAAGDPDADGLGNAVEVSRGYSPRLKDQVRDGGIATRRSAKLAFVAGTDTTYVFDSIPAGYVSQSGVVALGTQVATPALQGEVSGWVFSYWRVEGVRQAGPDGVALPSVRRAITGPTTFTAVYVRTTEDTDQDGLPDWYEWQQFGSLEQTAAGDPDADGLSNAVEAFRGYSPRLKDQVRDGGIATRRSAKLAFVAGTDTTYAFDSIPAGYVSQSGVVAVGSQVTTPALQGEVSGWVFSYWRVEGVRQAGPDGVALPSVRRAITGPTTFTAVYVRTTEDTDQDGLPDWYEWQQFGGLEQTAAGDPDADGLGNAVEAFRGYSPRLKDQVRDGGIATRRSAKLLFASVPPAPIAQTITFAALANRTFGESPFAVSATASSGLPVTLSVVSGPASVAGATVTLSGAGTVTLRATQAGNASYQAAEPVTQAFTVAPATPVITWNPPATVPVGTVLGAAQLNATATPAGGTFVYSPVAGTSLNTLGLQTLAVTYSPAGADAANYTPAEASRTVHVTAGSGPSASLQLVGPAHYLPAGGTVTVQAGIAYPGLTPSALGYTLNLPTGWTLASVGGSNVPNVAPTPGSAGPLEFAYSTLPAEAAAFTLVLNYPAGLSGTQTLSASATYRSPLQTLTIAPLALARLEPPAITTPPAGAVVRTGGNLTLTVVATSPVAPTYQWRKDGTALTGATNASLSLTSITLAQAGAYTVAVTNPAGTTVSAAAPVVVLDVQASHALSGLGYIAGGTVTVTNTLTYSPGLTTLSWEVLPPSGWTYASGAGSEGGTKPAVGTADLLTWSWSAVPASPVVFSYTLNVPVGATGEKTLSALVRPGVAAGALQVLGQPDPLRLPQGGHHSADTNRDNQISLLELTRVIELYNTRQGTSRTGAYREHDSSEDGFAGEPGRAFGANASLGRHHSADTDRNGRLSVYELTRVIELYNHREAGQRTGRYRVVHGTEDGFAPGG